VSDFVLPAARQNGSAILEGIIQCWYFFGFPVNVLNAIKAVPEVCRVFCATANPTEVIVAETEQGRGILGVIDGSAPQGVEGEADIAWRKGFLRQIGYKQ
jgi:hypothetical protein